MTVHTYLYYVILPILSFSIVLLLFRFLKGPTIVDRIVALDLLILIGSSIIAIYSIITDQPTFLDIAMILALIAFLSVVAFSYYLEKRNKDE